MYRQKIIIFSRKNLNKLISFIIMTTMKASLDASITIGDIDADDLFENYELQCLISKYQLSIGVKPIHLLQNQK